MNGGGPSGDSAGRQFDVTVNPAPPAERDVIHAEAEDEKKRDAALASTYDPEFARDGKTDEQLIKERDDQARLLADVAIVTGIVLAVEAAERDDPLDEEDLDVELEGEIDANMNDASD